MKIEMISRSPSNDFFELQYSNALKQIIKNHFRKSEL